MYDLNYVNVSVRIFVKYVWDKDSNVFFWNMDLINFNYIVVKII